jgi:hypothetical protein
MSELRDINFESLVTTAEGCVVFETSKIYNAL